LEPEGFDFAGGWEAFGLLEILHGSDGGLVPLAGGFALVEAFEGEGLLNFFYAGGVGGELAAGGGFFLFGGGMSGRRGGLSGNDRERKGKRYRSGPEYAE